MRGRKLGGVVVAAWVGLGCSGGGASVGKGESAVDVGAPTQAEIEDAELNAEMGLLEESLEDRPLTIRFESGVHLYRKGLVSYDLVESSTSIAAGCTLVSDADDERGVDVEVGDTFVLDGSTSAFPLHAIEQAARHASLGTSKPDFVAFDLEQVAGKKGASVYLFCSASTYDSSCQYKPDSCRSLRTKQSVRAAFEASLQGGPAQIASSTK